ncbi:nSTAND1 domain-containing NTPase [Nonomuraea sp. SBT364]|uniref:nSTAND1 domain-containing NTPase n=1 Tax=Nonomuraea sp. SBT364 TaxID=1580530 RepID=UPI00066BCA80|nr:AAA family ATPase [Nonomuraea sp. SBT364]
MIANADEPEAEPAGEARGRARAGVAAAVARHAAAGAAKLTPPALLAVLSAGALTPLAAMPPAQAAATIAAGVGTNILSQVVSDAIAALRRRTDGPVPEEEVERHLTDRLAERLAGDDADAGLLRVRIAALLREVEAPAVALEVAIGTGDHVLQTRLAEAFAALGTQFSEFAFLLTELETAAAGIQRTLHRQEGERRHDRQQVRLQSMQLMLLREEVAQLRQARSAALDGAPRWEHDSPYRGLWPFEVGHAPIFYGREQTTARLLDKIAERLEGPGLVVVTGASGAGKSSLVHAGLVPALARGMLPVPRSEHWPCLLLTPAQAPLDELATHLSALRDGDAIIQRDTLAERPDEAHLAVQHALLACDAPERARLVMVVDQFEEVFTLGTGEQREAFVTALGAAATTPVGPGKQPAALVVVIVRGDFIDRCAEYPVLAEALQDGQFVVNPMTTPELRRVITGPAAAAGLEVEAGLADAILADLGPPDRHGSGALPLLSQTMLVTWENREGKRLTIRGYGRGGGVAQAVQTSAEAVYESLSPPARDTARVVFRRMTAVSGDGQFTRRRTTRDELRALGERAGDADAVLEAFAGKRLIVLGEESAEIAHDYLLQAWPRLRGWLSVDQAAHVLHSQLVDDARDWQAHDRDPSFLYQGTRLEAARSMSWTEVADGSIVLDDTERAFLAAGTGVARRRDRQRRVRGIVLMLLLVILAGLGGFSEYLRQQSDQRQSLLERQYDQALARALSAQAENERENDRVRALKLSLAAWRLAPAMEARAALVNSVFRAERELLALPAAPVSNHPATTTLSGDGRVLARLNGARVEIWDLPGRTPRTTIAVPGGATDVWLADGGRVAAVGWSDGGAETELWSVRVFDARTGKALGAPITRIATAAWFPLIVTGGGRYFAVTIENGPGDVRTRFYHAATMRQIGQLAGVYANFVALDPAGRLVAVRKGARGVELRDLAGRDDARTLKNCSAGYGDQEGFFLDFNTDSSRLVLMPAATRGCLWDVRTGEAVAQLPHQDLAVYCGAAFAPEGTIITTCDQLAVYVWRASDGRLLARYPLPDYPRTVRAAGGHLYWTAGERVLTLDLGPYLPVFTLPHRPDTVVISQDATKIAAIAAGRLTVWDTGSWRVILNRSVTPLAWEGAPELAFSLDGGTLAVLDGGGVSKIDLRSGRSGWLYEGEEVDGTLSVSRDGVRVAAHLGDRMLLWDRWDADPVGTFPTPSEGTARMTPDGRSVITSTGADPERLHRRSAPEGTVRASADAGPSRAFESVTPDGASFALTEIEGYNDVTLWSAATMTASGLPFRTRTQLLHSMAFSPDGRLLVTAGETTDPGRPGGSAIGVWDVATRRPIAEPFFLRTSDVPAVAAGPDGHRVTAVTSEGDVHRVDMDPRSVVRRLCAVAGGGFTEREWLTYAGGAQSYRPSCG